MEKVKSELSENRQKGGRREKEKIREENERIKHERENKAKY